MRIPALCFVTVVAGSSLACKKPEAAVQQQLTSADVPIKAQVAPVEELPMAETFVLSGTLRASQESDVAADASGKVTATFVERGQRVKQGDTLAILDARGASITASAMNAQSQLALAQLEQARRECERVKSLKDTGAISAAEYDRVTSQCQTTEWSAAAAKAQQQNAQKVVGDSVIRAPFSGIIGERTVNVGQYVQPQTKIVSLYDPDPLRLELSVPEAISGWVKPEQTVVFTVAAFGDTPFTGTVKYISPNIRTSMRDLVLEAVCPNADLRLRPGMFAVGRIELRERPFPVVPNTALVTQSDGTHVFAVVNDRVEERIVQAGPSRDGKTGLLMGVKAGERVVVNPGNDVRDGARVQP